MDRGLVEFVLGVEAAAVEFDTDIFWGQFAERDFRAKRHLHSDFLLTGEFGIDLVDLHLGLFGANVRFPLSQLQQAFGVGG